MKRRRIELGILLAFLAVGVAVAQQPPGPMRPIPPGTVPSVWETHDLSVELQALPHPYTCNALWYKFRDVLLALGARPDLEITSYGCPPNDRADGRSPRVHLRFQTLRPTGPQQAYWADVNAVKRSIVLEPGQPRSLDASDCGLIAQIDTIVLPALDMHPSEAKVACGEARTSAKHGEGARAGAGYRIALTALVDPAQKAPAVAADGEQPALRSHSDASTTAAPGSR